MCCLSTTKTLVDIQKISVFGEMKDNEVTSKIISHSL